MFTKNSDPKCSRCGSLLTLISQETIQPEGTLYPQTNFVYRCSNEKCQSENDKQMAERVEQRQKKVIADQERTERIQEKRRLVQNAKIKGGDIHE